MQVNASAGASEGKDGVNYEVVLLRGLVEEWIFVLDLGVQKRLNFGVFLLRVDPLGIPCLVEVSLGLGDKVTALTLPSLRGQLTSACLRDLGEGVGHVLQGVWVFVAHDEIVDLRRLCLAITLLRYNPIEFCVDRAHVLSIRLWNFREECF